MARIPQSAASSLVTTPPPNQDDLLSADEVQAVQVVLVFLNQKHGLLLGHIGRQLSLGRNKDIQTHLRRGVLSAVVREEIIALCGLGTLEAFLNLPNASESDIETVKAALRSHQLIGTIRLRQARTWVASPAT